MENELMQIIVHAGNARSLAMQSIRSAKNGDTKKAHEQLKQSEADLTIAHRDHAKVLSLSANQPEETPVTLFTVHSEDHLMSAITTLDLAKEFLDVHQDLQILKKIVANFQVEEMV